MQRTNKPPNVYTGAVNSPVYVNDDIDVDMNSSISKKSSLKSGSPKSSRKSSPQSSTKNSDAMSVDKNSPQSSRKSKNSPQSSRKSKNSPQSSSYSSQQSSRKSSPSPSSYKIISKRKNPFEESCFSQLKKDIETAFTKANRCGLKY